MTDEGHMALHLAGISGSSARSRRTPQEQLEEFRGLDYLAQRELVPGERLLAVANANKSLMDGMVRTKWITREDSSQAQDAKRTVKIAVLGAATEDGKK